MFLENTSKMNSFCSKTAATISFIMFWDFSMFYQIFLSPQVKRWAIITYKHGTYERIQLLYRGLSYNVFHTQVFLDNKF